MIPMKRHLGLVSATLVALGIAVVSDVKDASAQATDIRPKKPNALMVLDNSGSMRWGLDGTKDIDCNHTDATPGNRDNEVMKPRWTILAETLTAASEPRVLERPRERHRRGERDQPNVKWRDGDQRSHVATVGAYQSNDSAYKEHEASIQTALFLDPTAGRKSQQRRQQRLHRFCQQRVAMATQLRGGLFTARRAAASRPDLNNRNKCPRTSTEVAATEPEGRRHARHLREFDPLRMASFDTLQILPSAPTPVSRTTADARRHLRHSRGCQFAIDGTRCNIGTRLLAPQYSYWYPQQHRLARLQPFPLSQPTTSANSLPPYIEQGGTDLREWRYDIGIRNSRHGSWVALLAWPPDWNLAPAGP